MSPNSRPDDHAPKPNQLKLIGLLLKPHVLYLLASGFLFNFLGIGAEVVFVLYSYTSVELGGMGRSVCHFLLYNQPLLY